MNYGNDSSSNKFLKTLSKEDKEKLKIMISHNIQCGRDYSIMNGIDVEQFNNELKLIFGGK